jgi:hypothetical protein
MAAGRVVAGRRPRGVGTTVDNGGRHVDALRTIPAVHLADTALRTPSGLSSTAARFLGASVSGSSRRSSPVSTTAMTTDENLNLRTGNDQNFLVVEKVDGAARVSEQR